jgi:hypothetical protein
MLFKRWANPGAVTFCFLNKNRHPWQAGCRGLHGRAELSVQGDTCTRQLPCCA